MIASTLTKELVVATYIAVRFLDVRLQYVLIGDLGMNLYINMDSFNIDDSGHVTGIDRVSKLLDCNTCLCSQHPKRCCEPATEHDIPLNTYVTFCTTWRPKYELVY